MKFDLVCNVTVSASTTVDAKSLDSAVAIARTRDVQLIYTGADFWKGKLWLIEDADGTPTAIREKF